MMTILTGKEFKAHAEKIGWRLVKFFASDNFTTPLQEHYQTQYQLGLNQIPKEKVLLDIKKVCSAGGFYFTYLGIWMFCHNRPFMFEVSVSDDAQVLIFEGNEKFKTDKLIILKKIVLSEEECFQFLGSISRRIRINSWAFFQYAEQIEELCLAAVTKNSLQLKNVKEQTNKICRVAVGKSLFALKYVKNQTTEICAEAIYADPWSIQYVRRQTRDLCLLAVSLNGRTISCVKQTEELCIEAVKTDYETLCLVKDQTVKICMAAVQSNGLALKFVKLQTEEMCVLAMQNGGATLLSSVKFQTEAICLAAVTENGLQLRNVKNQTRAICAAAVKQNSRAQEFVINKMIQ